MSYILINQVAQLVWIKEKRVRDPEFEPKHIKKKINLTIKD